MELTLPGIDPIHRRHRPNKSGFIWAKGGVMFILDGFPVSDHQVAPRIWDKYYEDVPVVLVILHSLHAHFFSPTS